MGAYRKVGNELLKIAREKVASSDMQNAGKVAKSMRLRVYTRWRRLYDNGEAPREAGLLP